MDVTKMTVGELVKEFRERKRRGSKDALVHSICEELSDQDLRSFLAEIDPNGGGGRWVRMVKHELTGRENKLVSSLTKMTKPKVA